MQAAHQPAETRAGVRLMMVDGEGQQVSHHHPVDLPDLLQPGDLLVLNDAATLPASLRGHTAEGAPIEIRLAEPPVDGQARAVVFGAGDWRTDTNDRPEPPSLDVGDRLQLGQLTAQVVEVDQHSARLVTLAFEAAGDALWSGLYASGQPVQYRHLEEAQSLWSFQTVYSGPPWAVEMPSAGRPLTWATLEALRARGVEWATLTHAAGLSATGDPELDARLPLPERTLIPEATVEAIARTRAAGGRIIATGTTVVRALEGRVSACGALVPGASITTLRLTPHTTLQVVDALLTGMHERHESHYQLLGAFVGPAMLEGAWRAAMQAGYRSHEFGDVALVLAESRPAP